MLKDIHLEKLSEISTPERSCLTLFLSGPKSLEFLDKKFEEARSVLKTGREAEKDEQVHFDENVKAVRKYLDQHPLQSGSLCLISCWILNFFQAFSLEKPVKDLLWIDSSPYIRPLAELQDEFENVAVVIADNEKARVFLLSAETHESEEVIKGNIKNHVRKGGWSQQRYERRRDKQLLLYAKEIAGAVSDLYRTEIFRRVVLVGGKEILQILYDQLPAHLQEMTNKKAIDLHQGEDSINKDIMTLFTEQERTSEQDLWEKIRAEYLRGGLGTVGPERVLAAALAGQVEAMVVQRDLELKGQRCRNCECLAPAGEKCPECGSDSVFEVDLVNEIVELVEKSGGTVDFTESIDTLDQAGGIAALLRYHMYGGN